MGYAYRRGEDGQIHRFETPDPAGQPDFWENGESRWIDTKGLPESVKRDAMRRQLNREPSTPVSRVYRGLHRRGG